MKKRALVSVSDKSNLISFAEGLQKLGYEIISTGGTLKQIQEAGITAKAVEEVTGFPEILNGRVKTLHPFIHGGLLADMDNPEHLNELASHDIRPIDLVVVNLYPFKQTLEQDDATEDMIIENIDIGGPTMLRAAAKNYQSVTVVVDPADYDSVLAALKNDDLNVQQRKKLAGKVFRHTAQYDALVADYFTNDTEEVFPNELTMTYEKVQTLRYGENPHQQAAFYQNVRQTSGSLAGGEQLHGKELSYNNIQDANSALEIISDYAKPTAVAVKHMNPCGIGTGTTLDEAFDRAYNADPISIFGGIVALNREVDEAVAKKLHSIFLEIVIAPSFSGTAFEMLSQKKNIRLIELDMVTNDKPYYELKTVKGGLLIQNADLDMVTKEDLSCVTERQPTERELEDLLFAWKAVKHVKSNAIVLAKDNQTIGIGAGQMNRVGAAVIAIEQAGEKAEKSAMASDAFFPMPDTVEAAARAGVTAIIQPGGSKRDQDSIDVCNAYDIAMVFTKQRHFRH